MKPVARILYMDSILFHIVKQKGTGKTGKLEKKHSMVKQKGTLAYIKDTFQTQP